MKTPQSLLIVGDETIKNAMKTMDSNGYGFVFIVGAGNKLQGVVTDGDVRRSLRKGRNINDSIKTIMNTKPLKMVLGKSVTASKKMLLQKIKLLEKKIKEPVISIRVPVVDSKGRLVKVVLFNHSSNKLSYLGG